MKRQRKSWAERYMAERRSGRNMFSAMFTSTWNSLGSMIGTYDATDPRNLAMRGTIARPTSAADLVNTQPVLRNLCRNLERNNTTVRAATEALVANVVGSGIALEPDTGDEVVDAKIRVEWNDFIRDCGINGECLYELQSLGFREVVVAGESLVRVVIDEARSKRDRIPLCVLPLEPEWLGAIGNTVTGNNEGFVGGIELDQYARPKTYHLTSPSGQIEKVPAEKIIHCFERRRALQIRGEPWFAPILTTIHQEKDLITAELEAAKNTAGFAAAITSHGGAPLDLDEKGSNVRNIQLGSVLDLLPGEDVKMLSHTRPSQQIAPFRDMLRGDEAGALRIGKRWLNRDISDANYSSMRADMLDNDRLLGPVREWYGHQYVGKLYKIVLPYLAIRAGVPVPKRDTYRLVPDGQPYVDPLKDAQAAAYNIAFGLSTYEKEIGKRGGDFKQVWTQLAKEVELAKSMGIALGNPLGTPGDASASANAQSTGGGNKEPMSSKKEGGAKQE